MSVRNSGRTSFLSFRIHCIHCKMNFKSWFNTKRHLVVKHGMDADQVQQGKAKILAQSAALAGKAISASSSGGRKVSETTGNNVLICPATIRPVKPMKVDVKNVSLAPMGSPCLLVGPPPAGSPTTCPVLAHRVTPAAGKTTPDEDNQQMEAEEEGEETAEIAETIPEDVKRKIMENINRKATHDICCVVVLVCSYWYAVVHVRKDSKLLVGNK